MAKRFNSFVAALARPAVLVLLCGTLPGIVPAQSIPILDHAKANCGAFPFPKWDIHKMWDYSSMADLEFRTTGDSETAFLVGLRIESFETGKQTFWFSDQKYLISMRKPGEVQSVPDAVWEEAEIVNRFQSPYTPELARLKRTIRDGEFDLANKTVKLRGKHWAGGWPDHAIYNRSKRYVALQSMNGKLLFDGEVYGGTAYVQVFDVNSGEELFWIEGKWKERDSGSIFKNTQWIRDDVLAVSFDPWLKRGTALCKVP